MKNYLNVELLAHLVRSKRGTRGLRDAAAEIGNISSSTLSRVENYNQPDMESFIALCNWLHVEPGTLFINSEKQQLDTIDEIAALLISDKRLDPTSAHVLVRIIKAAYNELLE